jgi:hypothetical protein
MQNPTAGLAMGFENSCQRKLNLDRRAAWQQRGKQQSQVQISVHIGIDNAKHSWRQIFFSD